MSSTQEPPEEPREEDLAPKPGPEEDLPEEGEAADDVQPLDVRDDEFMPPEEADADTTVDNKEQAEQPHDPATLDIAPD
jgi:hypothetical protein